MYRVGLALFVLILGLAAAFAGGVVLASLREELDAEAPMVSVAAERTTLVDRIPRSCGSRVPFLTARRWIGR